MRKLLLFSTTYVQNIASAICRARFVLTDKDILTVGSYQLHKVCPIVKISNSP